MGRACCVLGCPSGGDAPSHQIPKNPLLFQKWKNMIYSEKIQHMTDEQISKCTVCYRHFASDDYLITYRVRKLKRGIAPSLNLPNKPATSSSEPAVKMRARVKPEPLNASASIGNESTENLETEEATKIPDIVLFEDAPETLESYPFEQPPEQVLDECVQHVDSMTESEFKSYCRKRAFRRKRGRLKRKQLTLLRCKEQAKRYERTPTIQKIMSLLTPDEIAAVRATIRKSRYLPRVYVKVYNDIAKNMALKA